LLYQLSDAVNAAQSLEEVFEPALDVVIGALGVDRASVLLFDAEGVMRFRAFRGLSPSYRQAVEGHSPWSADDPNPQPLLIADVHVDESLAAYRELFRKEGIRALGFVPLVYRRRLLGKFMVYGDTPRQFTSHEVELARTIAAHIAQAVAHARLLDAERDARRQAELNAELMLRLQGLTASLSEAATPEQVARCLVSVGRASTRAATGGVWIVNDGLDAAELIHAEGYSPEGQSAFTQIGLRSEPAVPVTDVLRSGDALWLASTRELAERYPRIAAVAVARPEYRLVCLPIKVRDECRAALAFTFDQAAPFSPSEREFFLNIARQGSLALERSLLLEQEQGARVRAEAAHRRAAFKADASAALASSIDYETTLKNVAKLAVPRFADWCAVELANPDGAPSLVAVAHVDPSKVELAWRLRERYPVDPESARGVARILRTGVPELYSEISDETLVQSCRDEEHLALTRSLGLRSAISVPMSVHGRPLGAITFIWAESQNRYDHEDLEVATLIGQRAALAIENSRLHRDVQRAVQDREQLLAVVSHDLRNPLFAVALKADALRRVLPQDAAFAKAHQYAEGIRGSVHQMEQLLGDLLDLGSIEAGQLKVAPAACELRAVLDQAIEEQQPVAGAKNVTLRLEPLLDNATLFCDRRRVLQVFSNLIGNAVKFTPAGGDIVVQAVRAEGMVRISVRDNGPGIAEAHLPRIFDRYYRAHEGGGQRGMGLGLFIAKGIVVAHGGRIGVDSKPGQGSTFYFTLPLAPPLTPQS